LPFVFASPRLNRGLIAIISALSVIPAHGKRFQIAAFNSAQVKASGVTREWVYGDREAFKPCDIIAV
jgi:hypothetical protein